MNTTTARQTWMDKVTDNHVAGLTYDECAALQEVTNFEGEAYAAKLAEMRAIAAEMGITVTSGALCRLHALISNEALKHTRKRRAFGG